MKIDNSIQGMTSTDDLLAAWRKTYAEMFPTRAADSMPYDDSTLALGVTLEERFRAFVEEQTTKPGSLANLRHRTLDRLAKHNPSDPE